MYHFSIYILFIYLAGGGVYSRGELVLRLFIHLLLTYKFCYEDFFVESRKIHPKVLIIVANKFDI